MSITLVAVRNPKWLTVKILNTTQMVTLKKMNQVTI